MEQICDVVNKDHGLDKGVIADVMEKMYVEDMLNQKFHGKGRNEHPIKSKKSGEG